MALVAPAAPTSPMACNLLPPPLWVWYLLVLCHRCKSHGHAITLSIFLSLFSTALSSFCASIYLSICLSHVFFYLYIYLSIYLCISLFVWMSLNNSSHSSYSHTLSLSVTLTVTVPLPPTAPLSQWCNGPHCGPVVVLHAVQNLVSSEECLIFSISVSGVWANSCLGLVFSTATALVEKSKVPKLLLYPRVKE